MIKVTAGTNVRKVDTICSRDATPRAVLEEANIDYARGITNIDGATLMPGDIDKTFAELGIPDDTHCYLYSVVKTENA